MPLCAGISACPSPQIVTRWPDVPKPRNRYARLIQCTALRAAGLPYRETWNEQFGSRGTTTLSMHTVAAGAPKEDWRARLSPHVRPYRRPLLLSIGLSVLA